REQTISYCDTADGEIHRTKLRHQHDDVRAFYEQFTGEVIVGFEASGYSAWFEQMLAELKHTVWLGNAAEIRRKAPRRQKNDRRDAALMLDLMLKGEFPRVYTFSAESRTVLRQLRYRHKLVKVRTMAKNSLQAIAINAGLPLKRGLLTQTGMEKLKALPLPPELSDQRDEWLELITLLNERIATLEEALQQRTQDDAQIALLRSHPGIGLLTALALRYTLLPLSRFRSTRAVTAYVGFDCIEDQSGERRRLGSISKAGSRLLRFLLNEAGQTAARRDPELKRFYQRLRHRRDRPKAKVAVARKLLVRSFIMLRDQIDYAEFVRRGVAARVARKAHSLND
ncbi:MAG TPA: IS110 family transposase, partial [Pyrinomonadaceae bacterium]|nr:IS110 family transposase [Pyrinomonadaceae bacterium]